MIDIKDSYTACAIVEGFDFDDHDARDEINAWAYLIKTGQCWGLQGWYGRNATALIEQGFIDRAGVVDWDALTDAGIEV